MAVRWVRCPPRGNQMCIRDSVFTGWVGELHPRVNEALGFPAHSAAFELNLTALFATLTGKPVQAKPISTFPPVKQDLAFTVDETVTAGQLENVIRKAAGANLESIELFDVFTGEQVGEGKKSLAYAVVFRSPSKMCIRDSPYTLSGGEKRRLSVASMLAAAPKVLVMDEPTFGQDFSTWNEMVKLIATIRDQGSCVIMVTHDEALVDALGARRVMFEEAKA